MITIQFPGGTFMKRQSSIGLVLATLALSACTPVGAVVGLGATAGVAAFEERGIEGSARDLRTAASIHESWFTFDHTMPVNIGLEVFEGRALLTGVTADKQYRADAVRLAWKGEGVQDVINEIQISETSDALDTARDSWITTRLKTKMTFDEEVMAINYAIETVAGVVYLIGIAQNQSELDRVFAHARDVEYVQRIVTHVRVKGSV